MKAFRIEYWVQDTRESGHWELTGLIPKHRFTGEKLEKLLRWYPQGRIVDNDEVY